MSCLRAILLFFILAADLIGSRWAQGQVPAADSAPRWLSEQEGADQAAVLAAVTEAKSRLSATHGMTPQEVAVAAEMRTRVFKVGDFFAPLPGEWTLQQDSIQESLKQAGIGLPKGAGAFYNPESGYLVVTNTLENLDKTQKFVGGAGSASHTVVCAVTVIEGPGELIRQAHAASVEKVDASASLATLLGYARNAGAKVRVVGDCRVESLSGKPAKTEAVCEHAFPQPVTLGAGGHVAEVPWQTRQVGLRLELETEIGADHRTLDCVLSLELHPTPPAVRQARVAEPGTGQTAEFPVAEVNAVTFASQFSVPGGTTRLIGIAKPAGEGKAGGSEDMLWAAFATFSVRQTGNATRQLEPATLTPPATAAPLPTGMSTVLLQVPQGLVDPWRENVPQDQPVPSLRDWLVEQGIVIPPGASVEHVNDVLRFTNTPENIGHLVALLERTLGSTYRTTAFTLHTYQAPATLLRGLAHRSTATADDAAMLAAVEQAVAHGEAACIDSVFLETQPTILATHAAGHEHSYLSKFSSDAKGRPALGIGRRHVGSSFKVEVTEQDHALLVFDYTHELHTAPPAQRRVRFQDPATQKAFEMPVTDFHVARASGSLQMISGSTRLLALHAPVGQAADGPPMLCATFLRADAVPQACRYTNEAIAAREEKRAKAAAKVRDDPQAWETRTFRVPPDFLSGGSKIEHTGTLLRQIFSGHGVAFPEGAVISYHRQASTVFIKNTRENLALAEAFVNTILRSTPSTLVVSAQVIEGPGPLLRQLAAQASSKNDHRAELDALLAAVKGGTGNVRHVDMLHLEGKSGTPMTSGHGSEQPYLASVTTDEKGATVLGREAAGRLPDEDRGHHRRRRVHHSRHPPRRIRHRPAH